MSAVTLVTPTADRPAAFALCERWMRRALEVFGGEWEWIVADDGLTPAPCTLGQRHLRLPPAGDRKLSFLGNLAAGLRAATHDKLLFIEDDDWYAPHYLVEMARWLDEADIVGEARSRYYNLRSRAYRVMGNAHHASLCQMGIRRAFLPSLLAQVERRRRVTIDIQAWRISATGWRRRLDPHSTLTVGMKGLPGTPGLGLGHHMTRGVRWDPVGAILAEWTSVEDAELYRQLACEGG